MIGGNAVVFDVKDSDGSVNILFEHPLRVRTMLLFTTCPKFTHFLFIPGYHGSLRVAISGMSGLVVAHPDLAVKSHKTGQAWREARQAGLTDPSQSQGAGIRYRSGQEGGSVGRWTRVQFDVSLPAGGQKDASFVFQTDHPDLASV